jgi:flagellar biosynthesis protein FliQ
MALSYKARRRWSLLILVVGLPIYVVVAVTIMNSIASLPKLVELFIYVFLGVAWAFPLKFVFKGIGQADPQDTSK